MFCFVFFGPACQVCIEEFILGCKKLRGQASEEGWCWRVKCIHFGSNRWRFINWFLATIQTNWVFKWLQCFGQRQGSQTSLRVVAGTVISGKQQQQWHFGQRHQQKQRITMQPLLDHNMIAATKAPKHIAGKAFVLGFPLSSWVFGKFSDQLCWLHGWTFQPCLCSVQLSRSGYDLQLVRTRN